MASSTDAHAGKRTPRGLLKALVRRPCRQCGASTWGFHGSNVSNKVLGKAVKYVGAKGVTKFTPVFAESIASAIPSGTGLVLSIAVF